MSAQTLHRAQPAVPGGGRPLRGLPVPDCEPQAATTQPRPTSLVQVHPAQCALALVTEPPTYRTRSAPVGRAAPRRRSGVGDLDDDELGPRLTSTADLPDPEPLVGAVVSASIEVIAGCRPAAQLLRLLSAEVYAALQRRAVAAARQRQRAAPVRRAHVRRVLATAPCDGVVEASVVVQEGRRVLAVAVRLEGLDGRWRVTALEIG